jgi:hypothetical protein
MPVYNATNPVTVGNATKKDDYDRLFDNCDVVRAGGIAITAQAANDDMYATSATQWATGRRQLRQTFRGLRLQTHPDADLAPSKVWLDHADEIVMHDGISVLDWDDLAVDITASGAGGLDTGAEGASRWYEVYAIRKSSDGTKNLLLHRAKSLELDQSLVVGGNTVYTLRTGATDAKRGQTFLAGLSGPLAHVDFYLTKSGSPTGRLWATVYATAAGVPTGAALATSDKTDVTAITQGWFRFVFRTPYTIASGTTYAVVMEGDYANSGANYINANAVSPSAYANGANYEYNSGTTTWSSPGADLYFRTYVTQNDSAVTMPAGYDQRCLVGYVYNNGSSNFVPFAAADRVVTTYSAAVVTAAAIPILTFTDLAAFVPPVPVVWTAYQQLTNAGSGHQQVRGAIDRNGSFQTGWAVLEERSVGQVITNQHAYMMCVSGITVTAYLTGFQW